jgi:hypothetical protein
MVERPAASPPRLRTEQRPRGVRESSRTAVQVPAASSTSSRFPISSVSHPAGLRSGGA